ncbi:MAG: hypothetical protein JJT78_00160, partial [Leptospira sp.]|nr:hypothetical protein [Leptospira sp.]
MIGKVFNKLNKKWIRWSIYSIALLYLTFFRMDLDRNHLFITSDGQIKFYQTVQIAQGEFSKSNCLYPGRDLDPEYKFY